jgi:hypothetical protein
MLISRCKTLDRYIHVYELFLRGKQLVLVKIFKIVTYNIIENIFVIHCFHWLEGKLEIIFSKISKLENQYCQHLSNSIFNLRTF